MPRSKYQRTIEELNEAASKFWPSELSDKEAEISIIPLLLKTQDHFISIYSMRAGAFENASGKEYSRAGIIKQLPIPNNLISEMKSELAQIDASGLEISSLKKKARAEKNE